MKRIKPSSYLLALVLFGLCLFTQQLFAADTTTNPPADLLGWVNMVIVALTPVIIAGVKWVIPKIPKVILPFIAPIIGLLLDQIAAFVVGHQSNVVVGAIAGGLGVWLREALTQTQKAISPPTI